MHIQVPAHLSHGKPPTRSFVVHRTLFPWLHSPWNGSNKKKHTFRNLLQKRTNNTDKNNLLPFSISHWTTDKYPPHDTHFFSTIQCISHHWGKGSTPIHIVHLSSIALHTWSPFYRCTFLNHGKIHSSIHLRIELEYRSKSFFLALISNCFQTHPNTCRPLLFFFHCLETYHSHTCRRNCFHRQTFPFPCRGGNFSANSQCRFFSDAP